MYSNNITRSPTHPNFKEEKYSQSKIVLRYDGPSEANQDEVCVYQQPRGTYTLPVFKGLLAMGGMTSIGNNNYLHTTFAFLLFR